MWFLGGGWRDNCQCSYVEFSSRKTHENHLSRVEHFSNSLGIPYTQLVSINQTASAKSFIKIFVRNSSQAGVGGLCIRHTRRILVISYRLICIAIDTTIQPWDLPSHGQMFCFSLLKFTSSFLMTPWDPASLQMSSDSRWLAAGIGVPWEFCWVGSTQNSCQIWIWY